MCEFESIEAVAEKIKEKLDLNSNKKKLSILYAFNSTGKTRLSTSLSDLVENDNVLCYNAFVEDLFNWDNESFILNIGSNSWVIELINEQGLEKEICDNFRKLTNSKIEPLLNKEGFTFNILSGDDSSTRSIKISKGEESMFIWSIFYTVLETAIDALNTEEDNRTTDKFNNLEYIIIDDPVSSIDDTKIITMAIELIEAISLSENKELKIFIATHHALFYNVLYNSFNKKNKDYKFYADILLRSNEKFKLEKQKDSPFGYHILVKDDIQKAINDDDIKRYHFNLFRSLLEKISNFLGYKGWTECISGDKRKEFTRLINFYSHDRLSDLENKELPNEHKILFKETFDNFIKEFKWQVEKK